MQEGQEGFVAGRRARLVNVLSHTPFIRVLFLEESERYKLLQGAFVPYEDTVPRSHWKWTGHP